MAVFGSNLRHCEKPNQPAYCKPGFETAHAPFQFKTHDLHALLGREGADTEPWRVDAQPRIVLPPGRLYPARRLVDLEHARMHDALLPKPPGNAGAAHAAYLHWHESNAEAPRALWLTGLLPQFQRFRYDPQPRDDVALLPDEDEEALRLHRVQDGDRRGDTLYVSVQDSLCHPVPPSRLASVSVSPWPKVDLMEELAALAQAQGLSLQRCAQRYATASLPRSRNGWLFHEALGFAVKR